MLKTRKVRSALDRPALNTVVKLMAQRSAVRLPASTPGLPTCGFEACAVRVGNLSRLYAAPRRNMFPFAGWP